MKRTAYMCEHVRSHESFPQRALFMGSEHILICAECWRAAQNEALRDLIEHTLHEALSVNPPGPLWNGVFSVLKGRFVGSEESATVPAQEES